MRKVKARVAQFDFSSHCGAQQLKAAVKKLKSPTFFVMHGAEGNCQLLAKWIRKDLGLEAAAPKVGETVTL
jgi:Cft2 family RNA processing exonuclease